MNKKFFFWVGCVRERKERKEGKKGSRVSITVALSKMKICIEVVVAEFLKVR